MSTIMPLAQNFDGQKRPYFKNVDIPPIYDVVKTVDMLIETEKSFSRFGDGEFKLMTEPDKNHAFQRNSKELVDKLKEIITSNNDLVEVGINRIYYYKDGCELPYIEDFLYNKKYADLMVSKRYCEYLKRDHYYDSVFSIPYHHYGLDKGFFDSYFAKVEKIWEGRNVYLITGDTEIMGYDFNIFTESAKKVSLVEISKKDSFEYSDRIKRYVNGLGVSKKDDLLLFICGLAGTTLSYDMAIEDGYRCIDVGHIAKEYYAYKHGVIPYSNADTDFF